MKFNRLFTFLPAAGMEPSTSGVTSELCSRIAQHRDGSIPGFTKKYDVRTLVWFQYLDLMPAAIAREKQLKEWKRAWKLELI